MSFTEGKEAVYTKQRQKQLEAVQRPLEEFLRQWGLSAGGSPTAITLSLNHELHILFNARSSDAVLLVKVRPLFPGSLSQYDVIVEKADVLTGRRSKRQLPAASTATKSSSATRLHPISPQLFYERFHRSEKVAYATVDRCKRISILVRSEKEGLTQRFLSLILDLKISHPALFHDLREVNLVCLDIYLPKRVRKHIAHEVACAPELSSDICNRVISVVTIAESSLPALLALCVKSWVAMVDDRALAIDVLNTGTLCLLPITEKQEDDHSETRLLNSPAASGTEITPANLNQPEYRKNLIAHQRRTLVSQALPETAQTTVHTHFLSLATLIWKIMEEVQPLSQESYQRMRAQLAVQPHNAFCPLTPSPSKSFLHKVHGRRRKVIKKWKKLQNSPRQFLLDSSLMKWVSAMRQD